MSLFSPLSSLFNVSDVSFDGVNPNVSILLNEISILSEYTKLLSLTNFIDLIVLLFLFDNLLILKRKKFPVLIILGDKMKPSEAIDGTILFLS